MPMRRGYLSEYFENIAAKTLSAVEADASCSNQHEFNGVGKLKEIFGDGKEKQTFPARFIYLDDADDQAVIDDGFVTWYDARAKSADRTGRTEHRLYFPTTAVSQVASAGDLLVIARRTTGEILVLVAEGGSTIASQLQWLFGLSDLAHPGFSVRGELESEQDRIGFAARVVLESIGVETEETEESFLDEMLRLFGGRFPVTRSFSEYARGTLPDISPHDCADAALVAWMDREEILFRTLERHLVADRLAKGFSATSGTADVDGFIEFSLSVQNRRKSRVGFALENHIEQVFVSRGIRYARGQVTENKSKPDFLFPGITEYREAAFPSGRLTMLGSKSTCKDRWRQVLAEADRIATKHLFTIEAAISEPQTSEMQAKSLQLVLPSQLHLTYTPAQRTWLMDLEGFIELVAARQVA